MTFVQTALSQVFPPTCLSCAAPVVETFGLCGTCWRDTHFLGTAVCDKCGTPVAGSEAGAICDECLTIDRPWDHGRAALAYGGSGRKMVLGLKHGDRHDVVPAAAQWMEQASRGLHLAEDALAVPVPLHWRRQMSRKFNQSALLAQAWAARRGFLCVDTALKRVRNTVSMDGKSAEERFRNVDAALKVRDKYKHLIAGRDCVIVDDVMTSGATFHAAANALRDAGAARICVLALARVVKQP